MGEGEGGREGGREGRREGGRGREGRREGGRDEKRRESGKTGIHVHVQIEDKNRRQKLCIDKVGREGGGGGREKGRGEREGVEGGQRKCIK